MVGSGDVGGAVDGLGNVVVYDEIGMRMFGHPSYLKMHGS